MSEGNPKYVTAKLSGATSER